MPRKHSPAWHVSPWGFGETGIGALADEASARRCQSVRPTLDRHRSDAHPTETTVLNSTARLKYLGSFCDIVPGYLAKKLSRHLHRSEIVRFSTREHDRHVTHADVIVAGMA